MSRRSPFEVQLCSEDRSVLELRASSRSAPHSEVVRARIVLLAAEGARNIDIAKRVGVCVDVVSKWRQRFCQHGLAGLKDRPRSGRPRTFGPAVLAGVKALACEPPEQHAVPLSRWSSHELAAQAVTEGLVDAISSSTRSPSCRRCIAAIRAARRVRGISRRSSSSTSVAERSPTWAPMTCTAPIWSARSLTRPASCRSWNSSTRS